MQILDQEKVRCQECAQVIAHKLDGKLRFKTNRWWVTVSGGTVEIPCRNDHLTVVRLTGEVIPV